jgi:alpha-tubulin suppressor-like RCC1 family protein
MNKISTVLLLSLFIFPCQTALAITPDIAASPFHYMTLKNDGTVWAWGQNATCPPGATCPSPEVDSDTPVQVSGLTRVIAIAKSGEHSMALRYDGTVWTWGKNNYFQLGDGTTTDRAIPAPVPNLSGVKAIAAGGSHSVALKDDGTVWSWGYNDWGAIGDGTATNRSSPVLVPNLSGIKAIAAYGNHNMALKDDGTVWVWGGSIGGTTPLQVENLSGVTAIAQGGSHDLVLKNDGTVWSWGAIHTEICTVNWATGPVTITDQLPVRC